MKILLLDSIPEELAKAVSEDIEKNYAIKPSIARMPSVKDAFNPIRHQHSAEKIIASLKKDFDEFIAITGCDIYSENLAFTFGNASGKNAVISTFRLRPEFYRQTPDAMILKNRLSKKALHEAGHILGLDNCWISGCVMTHVNTVGELDALSKNLCQRCRGIFRK
ncbi:MAG: archaemetzincin [Candidatus Aenigmatarchaeota archaeon]